MGSCPLWVVQLERPRAFRACGDDSAGACGLQALQIQPGKCLEGLQVTLPELVVSTAPLVGEDLRLDAQMVENTDGSMRDLDPFDTDRPEQRRRSRAGSRRNRVYRMRPTPSGCRQAIPAGPAALWAEPSSCPKSGPHRRVYTRPCGPVRAPRHAHRAGTRKSGHQTGKARCIACTSDMTRKEDRPAPPRSFPGLPFPRASVGRYSVRRSQRVMGHTALHLPHSRQYHARFLVIASRNASVVMPASHSGPRRRPEPSPQSPLRRRRVSSRA